MSYVKETQRGPCASGKIAVVVDLRDETPRRPPRNLSKGFGEGFPACPSNPRFRCNPIRPRSTIGARVTGWKREMQRFCGRCRYIRRNFVAKITAVDYRWLLGRDASERIRNFHKINARNSPACVHAPVHLPFSILRRFRPSFRPSAAA